MNTIVTTVQTAARKRYRTARLMLSTPRCTHEVNLNSF